MVDVACEGKAKEGFILISDYCGGKKFAFLGVWLYAFALVAGPSPESSTQLSPILTIVTMVITRIMLSISLRMSYDLLKYDISRPSKSYIRLGEWHTELTHRGGHRIAWSIGVRMREKNDRRRSQQDGATKPLLALCPSSAFSVRRSASKTSLGLEKEALMVGEGWRLVRREMLDSLAGIQ
ncbi:hypothetical protein DL96DRAFT_1609693 [Flagelloscypha sp. PMI_526]|nr:hypothetical protein DL96DRAFT_1609693 [Flagelloscypha sp. PMI_526]